MRSLSGAAVLAAVLLLSAGCSADEPAGVAAQTPSVAAAAPGASGAAPQASGDTGPDAGGPDAGDAALAGNTRAICAQAAKTGGDFAATFAEDLKLLIDASSAKDPDLAAKVEQKTARDVQNYSFALTDLSKLASDRAVSKALADMGRQVTELKGDVRKLDERKLDALRATLDKACGSQ